MSAFKVQVTHKPTGIIEEFGPWEDNPDPNLQFAHTTFVHGFIAGLYAERYGVTHQPEDLDIEVIADITENQIVSHFVAEASASVTHADGSTD